MLIRNDPEAPPVCRDRHGTSVPGPGPIGRRAGELLSEIASPLRALLNARTARGRLAEVDAAKRVERSRGAVIEMSLAAVVQSELDHAADPQAQVRITERMVEPPLGWSLSTAVRDAMDETLRERRGGLATALANLATVLDGGLEDYVPCGAR